MADNVQLNGVSVNGGKTVATLDIGGVQYQMVLRRAVTAAEGTIAASASSVEIIAANPLRENATIRNDSSAVLYLSMGFSATTSSPIRLLPQDIYELPCRYVGAVNGIWESATGNAQILEFS